MIADPQHRFTGLPVLTAYIDGQTWELQRNVSYRTLRHGVTTVRAPFSFDWASVPRAFWRIFPPAGMASQPYGIAALVHDWLYVHQHIDGSPISRLCADRIFLEIMQYLRVPTLTRRFMYAAVRVGGWPGWNRNRAEVTCAP